MSRWFICRPESNSRRAWGVSPQEEKDGPQLFLFLAPGDGGVLGGWALEREANEAYEEIQERHPTEPKVCTVIQTDLSSVRDPSQDPRQLAAILWRTAARLQSPLWEMAEYRRTSFITVTTSRPVWVCG
jgi:hypothetical protein